MVVPLPDYINGELKEMLMNMLNLDADKRPTAKELLETELMLFQDQIDKYKEINDQQSKEDDENRQIAIDIGVVDALIHLFNAEPLDSITPTHAWAFFVFTYPSSYDIRLHLAEKKPFPALFRLLDHQEFLILRRTIASVFNILIGVADLTLVNQPHPHFQAVASCGGIEKLYSLFKKNEFEKFTYFCALSIGQLFKAKEIPNIEMRKDVISQLKAALTSSDRQSQLNAKLSLKKLAENSVNSSEIEKDGFKIPD
ncbi:MAG: hypothetical protein EZS28_039048 [Streblomastix strix]|uniref:Protein kinase domain-containing protein n=1 Tax=Streblomastix strix TaxID=222440 RepID=A0A5J4U3N9_9EUKA|nr:MAG: hypothetical protein EZS28_039048 [Streblomastix strix]